MHIPDGYLGPQTYLTAYGVMVPVWAWASSRVKRAVSYRQAPLLALSSAFCFVVMMFNIPAPGGTSGHAVGAVLVAILLGPWAAVLSLSTTLAVQALLFGDGGITAFAANCLSMAVVMPATGWLTFRLLAGRTAVGRRRFVLASAAGGYVGLNAAALTTAVMLGIQPALAHDASGRALYCPFALDVAVPAMALEHLFLFGVVEAVVTGLVVAEVARTEPWLISGVAGPTGQGQRTGGWRRLALTLGVLVALVPVGVYMNARYGGAAAWGEWKTGTLERWLGYVPTGLARLQNLWHPPAPDYAPQGMNDATPLVSSAWALPLTLVGVAVLAGLVLAARRWLWGKETDGIAS